MSEHNGAKRLFPLLVSTAAHHFTSLCSAFTLNPMLSLVLYSCHSDYPPSLSIGYTLTLSMTWLTHPFVRSLV